MITLIIYLIAIYCVIFKHFKITKRFYLVDGRAQLFGAFLILYLGFFNQWIMDILITLTPELIMWSIQKSSNFFILEFVIHTTIFLWMIVVLHEPEFARDKEVRHYLNREIPRVYCRP